MVYKRLVLSFLLLVFLTAQSALAVFALSVTAAAQQSYAVEKYAAGEFDYYNFKNPACVIAEDILNNGETTEIIFVSDSETGSIYLISEKYGDKIISDAAVPSPTRLRVAEKTYLYALSEGVLYSYDIPAFLAGGAYEKGALDLRDASDNPILIKDFIIKSVMGVLQLYIISANDSLMYFSINIADNLSDGSLGTVIGISNPSADRRPIALASYEEWVYVLCNRSYMRFRVHNTQEFFSPSLDRPTDITVVHAEDNTEMIFISDNDGIKSFSRGNRLRTKSPRPSETTGVKLGEIVTVGSLHYKNGMLYTSDISAHAKCVQRFIVNTSTGNIGAGDLFLGGKGGDSGRLYDPSGVAAKRGKVYIADTQNKRIQIWKDNAVVSILDLTFTVDGESVDYSPLFLTVTLTPDGSSDEEVLIYTATNNKILCLSESGELSREYEGTTDGQLFRNLSGIASSIEGTVYATDESSGVIYYKTAAMNGFEVFRSGLRSPVAIAVSLRTSNVYVSEKTGTNTASVKVYNASGEVDMGFSLDASFSSVTAIALDYRDTVFIYAERGDESVLLSYTLKTSPELSYESTEFVLDGEPLTNIRNISICEDSGVFYIADLNNNAIKIVPRDTDIGIFMPGDAPQDLPPPVYVKRSGDTELFPVDYEVRVATVINYTGTAIYPIDEKFAPQNENHPNYPVGYAYTEIIKINQGEKLLVLDDTSDDVYAYVLYNGMAGFMLKSGLEITPRDLNDRPAYPDEFALTLYSNVEIFKFPSLKTDGNGSYSYLLKKLPKDEKIKLICRVPDFSDNNTHFYEIQYCTEDSAHEEENCVWETAFVRRYQVTPNISRTPPAVVNARIKAPQNSGLVPVYEMYGEGASPAPDLLLRDNTLVEVLDDPGQGWVLIQWYESGNTEPFSGWVEAQYLVYSGLTAMQIVGIIILVLAIVTLALTIWLRKRKKVPEQTMEQIRY